MTTNPSNRKTMMLGAVACAALVVLGELTGSGPLLLGGRSAEAVVGRPLTPISYAGVARRTTRRAVYAHAVVAPVVVAPVVVAHPVVVAPVVVAPVVVAPVVVARPVVIMTLPANCVQVINGAVVQYQCGSSWYVPQYSGPNLVYVPIVR